MKKKTEKSKSQLPTPQDMLFNSLFGFGPEEVPEPPPIYRVRLACEASHPNTSLPRFSKIEDHLPHPDRPIPGLFTIRKYGFENTIGLEDARERLEKRIEEWKARMDNCVNVKIHLAKCAKWNDLFFYVEMLPSKWISGWGCPWREYNALRQFIKSLPEYQSEP